MLVEKEIPAEPFELEVLPDELKGLSDAAPAALTGIAPRVVPRITVKGTVVTIRLTIELLGGADTETFTLSPANRWRDEKKFFPKSFLGAKSFTISIAAETAKRRIHVHFSKKPFAQVDKYFPYANFSLPTDYAKWTSADPKKLAEIRAAFAGGKPLSAPKLTLQDDAKGPADSCSLLGADGFIDHGRKALASPTLQAAPGAEDLGWLIAIGILDDAAIAAGGFIGTGFWFTTKNSRCGWYSGFGGTFGSFVGIAVQLVVTLVWSADPIGDFEKFHVARGILGEAGVVSFGFLGDVSVGGPDPVDAHGVIIGGGVGAQVSPASGFVGAGRNFLLDF